MSQIPATTAPKRYVSNGQVLARPPWKVRMANIVDRIVLFVGLYITTLFSLDPHSSALASAYNIHNRVKDGSAVGRGTFARRNGGRGGSNNNGSGNGGDAGGGGGGGWGSGFDGRGGGAGGVGRRLGQVDDVRGPECSSCG